VQKGTAPQDRVSLIDRRDVLFQNRRDVLPDLLQVRQRGIPDCDQGSVDRAWTVRGHRIDPFLHGWTVGHPLRTRTPRQREHHDDSRDRHGAVIMNPARGWPSSQRTNAVEVPLDWRAPAETSCMCA
jgi:hypothetical protein